MPPRAITQGRAQGVFPPPSSPGVEFSLVREGPQRPWVTRRAAEAGIRRLPRRLAVRQRSRTRRPSLGRPASRALPLRVAERQSWFPVRSRRAEPRRSEPVACGRPASGLPQLKRGVEKGRPPPGKRQVWGVTRNPPTGLARLVPPLDLSSGLASS